MSEQCLGRVWRDHRYQRCIRSGSVERGTAWYCKQHDPIARQERLQERAREQNEKWAAESKERHRRAIANLYHHRLVDALREAELDCRGYDALHGWMKNAVALLAEIDKEAANG